MMQKLPDKHALSSYSKTPKHADDDDDDADDDDDDDADADSDDDGDGDDGDDGDDDTDSGAQNNFIYLFCNSSRKVSKPCNGKQ